MFGSTSQRACSTVDSQGVLQSSKSHGSCPQKSHDSWDSSACPTDKIDYVDVQLGLQLGNNQNYTVDGRLQSGLQPLELPITRVNVTSYIQWDNHGITSSNYQDNQVLSGMILSSMVGG